MDPRNRLHSDFAQLCAVAEVAEGRSEELRATLGRFGTAMLEVPPSVWGGQAAHRFRAVMTNWNTESARLCAALSAVAQTLRGNAAGLRQAGVDHADRIGAAGAELDGR